MRRCSNNYDTCNGYYARGWCVNCYSRWLKRGTTDFKHGVSPTAICIGPECDRVVASYGTDVCGAHYQQRWAGKPLKPLRWYSPAKNGHKECSACHQVKPVDDFYKRTRGGWWSHCKDCEKVQRAARKAGEHNE